MIFFRINTSKNKIAQEKMGKYFTKRRKFTEDIAHFNSNLRLWQMLALLGMLGCIGSLIVCLMVSMQTTFVPYIVEVDQLGQTIAVRPAERVKALDDRIVHAQLASFIINARTVTPDAQLQKKAILSVYALLPPNEGSIIKMNQWFNGTKESSPFKRAEKLTVSVNIQSIVAQSEQTWQVDWVETVYDRSGKVLERLNMRALLNVFVVPPDQKVSLEQIRINPTGLYIRDFNWSKQTQ